MVTVDKWLGVKVKYILYCMQTGACDLKMGTSCYGEVD